MSNIVTKITQSVDFKKKDRIPYINAVILMGLFTFLFLGAEYLPKNSSHRKRFTMRAEWTQ